MNEDMTLELAGCPQCAAAAEILDRFELPSTDGPVAHVTVLCVRRHRFTMDAAHLRRRPVSAPSSAAVVEGSGR